MEVAGLVLAVAATWKTCIEVFDLVGSSRSYGVDYELSRVKLDVEKVRLIAWGDAVGLDEVQSQRRQPDPRLRKDETRTLVVRILGNIQRIFEDSEKLQSRYGLSPDPSQSSIDAMGASSSSSFLGKLRRASAGLKRTTDTRQKAGHLGQKTVWVIRDRTKFMQMVVDIRELNDSLAHLFPDLSIRAALKKEIYRIKEIRNLRLLQQASADDNSEISDITSSRLEDLSSSATNRLPIRNAQVPNQVPDPQPLSVNDERSTIAAARIDHDRNDHETADDVADGQALAEQVVRQYVFSKADGAVQINFTGPLPAFAETKAFVTWVGEENKVVADWTDWQDKAWGIRTCEHASYELYWKNKFNYFRYSTRTYNGDDDDGILIDPESNPKYENVNPGTVTAQGYALERWDYQELFGNMKERPYIVSRTPYPDLFRKRIFRKIDQLRRDFFRSSLPGLEKSDLGFFLPYSSGYSGLTEEAMLVERLNDALNRSDLFVDFRVRQIISNLLITESSMLNLLWNIILARELVVRLQISTTGHVSLTHKVLAALIIAEQWIKNVEIVIKDPQITFTTASKTQSREDVEKAEQLKEQGNKAFAVKAYQEALDLYNAALKIDGFNAIYWCNRAAAQAALDRHTEAWRDAWSAKELDPKYAKAWARLGAASMKIGELEESVEQYRKAISLAGRDATITMRNGLTAAETKVKEWQKRYDSETDVEKKMEIQLEKWEQAYVLKGRQLTFASRAQDIQAEGLLTFAETMRWPFLEETRGGIDEIWSRLRAGGTTKTILLDWWYGLCLPGKYMSTRLMSSLVFCTPSLTSILEPPSRFAIGLVLSTLSYWRIRTVVGRVLGALPGVKSLCGWLGPCPQVEFDPPSAANNQPQYVRIRARQVTPLKQPVAGFKGQPMVFFGDAYDRLQDLYPQSDEDLSIFSREVTDDDRWIHPEPPTLQLGIITLNKIIITQLPDPPESGQEREYSAQLAFSLDGQNELVTYHLRTNPIFVTPPACSPGPNGPHQVHMRELKRFNMMSWTAETLKEWRREGLNADECMIINATSTGADVLARAWCSENGKNAIVRRKGGPCYVCTVRAAQMLDINVVIWTG